MNPAVWKVLCQQSSTFMWHWKKTARSKQLF